MSEPPDGAFLVRSSAGFPLANPCSRVTHKCCLPWRSIPLSIARIVRRHSPDGPRVCHRAFRFSVKIPRAITHDQQLTRGVGRFSDALLGGSCPAGRTARLPARAAAAQPRVRFEGRPGLSDRTTETLRSRHRARAEACELVRGGANRLLNDFKVARVAADPPRAEVDVEPGGWPGLAYFRLHGSPRIYYSPYEDKFLDSLAEKLRALRCRRIPTWCIFDNTTLGAATGNALSLMERL